MMLLNFVVSNDACTSWPSKYGFTAKEEQEVTTCVSLVLVNKQYYYLDLCCKMFPLAEEVNKWPSVNPLFAWSLLLVGLAHFSSKPSMLR